MVRKDFLTFSVKKFFMQRLQRQPPKITESFVKQGGGFKPASHGKSVSDISTPRDMITDPALISAGISRRHLYEQLGAMAGRLISPFTDGNFSATRCLANVNNVLPRQTYFRTYFTAIFRRLGHSKDVFHSARLQSSSFFGGGVADWRVGRTCRMYSDPGISDIKEIDDEDGLVALSHKSMQKFPANASSQSKVIHPTAIVHPDANLGEGIIIGPFCTVGQAVKLGNHCQLHSGIHITGNTELGEGCVVLTGAVVGADLPGRTVIGNNNLIGYHAVVGVKCQDAKYKDGDDCFLYIGNNNDIREHASIHRSSKSTDETVIGDNNLVMGSCHIAHDCKVGNHNIFANGTLLGGHVVVEDYVHTGGAVAVHQYCHLGSFAFLAGGSVTSRDVPMYMMVAGDRAVLRGLNLEGLRRHKFSNLEIKGLRRAYQKLFMCTDLNSGGLDERLVEVEQNEELANVPAVLLMVQSVRDCFKENRRGICNFKHWTSD